MPEIQNIDNLYLYTVQECIVFLTIKSRKKEDAHTWSSDRTGLEGAAPNLKGGGKHDFLSQNPDLAKLNRNRH